jgi:hypothetical protein
MKNEIKELIQDGWTVTSESKYGTTLEKNKKFSILWLILFSFFYLVYYIATKKQTKFITK